MDEAFAHIKCIASDVKMRDFQYRFLHRKIYTNYILKIWKLSDTDRCTFCENDYETVEHLFFRCPITKRFWTLLTSWYEAMTDTEIVINDMNILFCRFLENKTHILDSLILMAKQHICIQMSLS